MNKLIFLDFDGVINRCDADGWLITKSDSMIEVDLVGNVAQIVEATGASVVISSTWREQYSLFRLQDLLQDHGLDPRHVIDVTPDLRETTRGHEIAAFLKGQGPTRFVVLDDNDSGRFDMRPVRRHLVRTGHKEGVTAGHVRKAQKLLLAGPVWSPEVQSVALAGAI